MNAAVQRWPFSVRVDIEAGNRNERVLLDLVRRLADHLGKHGIMAKSGETTDLAVERGYLRLRFPNRKLAKRYQQLVEEFFEYEAATRRMKRRTKK